MYGKRVCVHTLLVTIIDHWVAQLPLLYLLRLTIKTVIAIMMINEGWRNSVSVLTVCDQKIQEKFGNWTWNEDSIHRGSTQLIKYMQDYANTWRHAWKWRPVNAFTPQFNITHNMMLTHTSICPWIKQTPTLQLTTADKNLCRRF